MRMTVILLMLFALFPLNTAAQHDTKLGLPAGAKARFGKDHITGNITYSPDGTRLALGITRASPHSQRRSTGMALPVSPSSSVLRTHLGAQ